MNRSFLRFAAVVSFALAGCGGAASGTDAGTQGADAGQTPNPFYPQDLQDAVDRLTMELGPQPEAGDVRENVISALVNLGYQRGGGEEGRWRAAEDRNARVRAAFEGSVEIAVRIDVQLSADD